VLASFSLVALYVLIAQGQALPVLGVGVMWAFGLIFVRWGFRVTSQSCGWPPRSIATHAGKRRRNDRPGSNPSGRVRAQIGPRPRAPAGMRRGGRASSHLQQLEQVSECLLLHARRLHVRPA